MAYSFGILHSHGASACTLPDTMGATCTARRCPSTGTPLYPGDVAVRHGERWFENYLALAEWLLDNKQAQRVTLPNHRCEMCDSDGCFIGYNGRYFDTVGCFADWLEDNGEGERDIVPDNEEGAWGM